MPLRELSPEASSTSRARLFFKPREFPDAELATRRNRNAGSFRRRGQMLICRCNGFSRRQEMLVGAFQVDRRHYRTDRAEIRGELSAWWTEWRIAMFK